MGAGVGGGAAAPASSAAEMAKAQIRAARLVPEAEIESIIPPVSGVMLLVMRRGYQPAARGSMNKRAREHLPPHMIADPHDRHDREYEPQHRDMDRDQEDERGDDDRAGNGLQGMETHRRPRGRRAAFVMNRMDDSE